MGRHRFKQLLSFISRIIDKWLIMLSEPKVVEVSKKPLELAITKKQNKDLTKVVDELKKQKEVKIGLGSFVTPQYEAGTIITEKVVEDMETGKKKVVKTVISKKDAEAQKTECGHWALTEAVKNDALDGAPGYLVISDNFGKAVKLKVDNINVDVKNVKVDRDKYKLQGELRITGRTPVN